MPQNLAVEQQPHRRGRAAKKADVDRRRPVSVWQPAAEQGRLNGAARLPCCPHRRWGGLVGHGIEFEDPSACSTSGAVSPRPTHDKL